MTTVVWDGRYLAADGQTTNGDMISGLETRKILKLRKDSGEYIICAFSGLDSDVDLLIGRVISGKEHKGELDANLITIENGEAFIHGQCEKGYWKAKCTSDDHIGSGRKYAAAAINCGKNAMDAVIVAMNRDIYTGGTIRFFDTKKPALGVQIHK